MGSPRRENLYLQERGVLNHAHAQLTATATELAFKPIRDFLVERILYVNETGLVQDAVNFFKLEAKNGVVSVAEWSTEIGAEGTIAASTFVTLTPSIAAGALHLAADDVLSLVFTEDGTATLPAGKFQIEGRYL